MMPMIPQEDFSRHENFNLTGFWTLWYTFLCVIFIFKQIRRWRYFEIKDDINLFNLKYILLMNIMLNKLKDMRCWTE
jgi:hypothetical protein